MLNVVGVVSSSQPSSGVHRCVVLELRTEVNHHEIYKTGVHILYDGR